MLYSAIGLCLADVYWANPALLRGWSGVGLLALIGAFCLVFQVLVFLGLFISFAALARQRFALLAVVGALRRAKAELEASAAQVEELAALRERARLAREMHDSLGHALVLVNVKLEAAERLYTRDAAGGAARSLRQRRPMPRRPVITATTTPGQASTRR